MIFPKIVTERPLPGYGTTTLGGETAISGDGTPDTGDGTPFQLNLITAGSIILFMFIYAAMFTFV